MKSPSYSVRSLLTHVGCLAGGLLLGYGVWKAVGPSAAEAASSAEASSREEQRASERRRERTEPFKDGTEILKAVAPHLFQPEESSRNPQSMTYAAYLRNNAARILEAADKLEPAADVAAAAIALLEKSAAMQAKSGEPLSPEEMKELQNLSPRLVHWLRADPVAAMRYLSGQTERRIDMSSPIFAVMTEKGADAAIGWLKDSDPPLGRDFQYTLSMFVGSSGDVEQLEKLRQAFTPGQWNQMNNQIAYAWPFEKADELFKFAVSQSSPLMAVRLANSKGKEGADWLMGQLNSETLDPAFKEAITGSRDFQQLLRSNPHIPLETRLEFIGKGEPNKDKEQLALEVGSRDVSNALDDASRDWRFAFRSGKVTFEEVYDAVVADLPELAAGSPDAIRLQVFKELAEENGTAALEALAHTPEPDKWILALKPTQWMFHGVDPQKFYDYLQNVPSDDPALHQARFESWVWHSQGNLATYSRDYVNWVKEMPEGIDREMAAVGILRAIGNSNDANLRSEVDSLIRDPAMRARIQAPPPTKK